MARSRTDQGKLSGPFVPVFESLLRDPRHLRATAKPWFSMLCHLWMRAQYTGGQVEIDVTAYAAVYGVSTRTIRDWLLEMEGKPRQVRGRKPPAQSGIQYLAKVQSGRSPSELSVYECLRCHTLDKAGKQLSEANYQSPKVEIDPKGSVKFVTAYPVTSHRLPGDESPATVKQVTGYPVTGHRVDGVSSYSDSGERENRERGRRARAHAREPDHPPKPEPDTGHPPQGQAVSPKLDHFAAWDYLTDELSHPFDRMPQGVGKRIDQALAHSTDRAPLELAVGMIQRQIADDPRRAKFAIHDAIQLWALEAKKASQRQAASQHTTQRDPKEAQRTAEIIALQQAHRQRRRAKTGGLP